MTDAERITAATQVPLLVDIDTGWGGAFNIARAVRRLEKAGVIRGYRAVVQLPAPVYPVIVAAQVALADHALSQQAFIKELQRSEAVLDAWLGQEPSVSPML